ncbi:MAG: cell division protein FtsL [Spirochaetaceae bacterium]|jgi:cell division protein FtsL|nr:cell division protein FtsL [Spirochaetaceae bacterium]
MGRLILLYAIVLSIPLSLGASAWQAARYDALKTELELLNKEQERLVDDNKRLITEIAGLSSSARIEEFARGPLGLNKKSPEDVLQIRIYGKNDARR